jgi:membrane carboxypeptidase/penicillin-binding protein PbpC
LIDPGTSTKLNFGEKSAKSSEAFITQPISDVLVNLLIQVLPSGETVAFKTGTSAYRENAWSVQIFRNHLVIAWFGTPDNEPTDILTGLQTAFPISNEIGRR